MADVITKFKLETTQFDSKLRDTAKALHDIADTAQNAGKDFNNFSKKSIEAARSLGTVASGATNTKDRLRDLVGSYNDAVKAYDKLGDAAKQGEFGKAMAASLQQLQQRIKETKSEIYDLGNAMDDLNGKSSGLFGEGGLTGMLQVAGGNLMASGIEKIVSGITDAWSESIELARAGDGVRMAFERLNQPDLLDKLKEATHGTVSDVELMKQAIKFENFKLPLEDLATYLAFAQQKAKDTGESVDYMVNSITTGLGRQSKQILDNLGISAAELTKRMNEGADMTKAVADIIREEMAKAGDYVETAADRAARAAADAQNQMEEFGRQAAPIAEEWSKVWNALSIGAMDFANTLLGPLADSIRSLQELWNNGWEDNIINSKFNIENGNYNPPKTGYQGMGSNQKVTAPGGYVEVTDSHTGEVIGGRHFDNTNDLNAIKDWRKSLFKKGRNKKTGKTTPTYEDGSLAAQMKLVQDLTKKWNESGEAVRGQYLKPLVEAENKLRQMKDDMTLQKDLAEGKFSGQGIEDFKQSMRDAKGVSSDRGFVPWGRMLLNDETLRKAAAQAEKQPKRKKEEGEVKSVSGEMSKITGSVQGIFSGIQQLGIELPEGLQSVLSGIQGVTTILMGISSLITVITAIQGAKATPVIGWLLAGGGIIKAAGGTLVGNSYSGDNLRGIDPSGQIYGLNAGEVVLNKSQQGNLASQLSGSGMQGMKLDAVITGEQIRLVLNNNGRRTGRGEYVQTKSGRV